MYLFVCIYRNGNFLLYSVKLVNIIDCASNFKQYCIPGVTCTYHHFSSLAQLCLTLCNPMDPIDPMEPMQARLPCPLSMPSLLKIMSIESVMPPNHLIHCYPLSYCLQSFPASGSFQMSQFFASGGQSIGVSTSTSVLSMNIQD